MKKITLLTTLLVSFLGFSQANKQMIQSYLDSNRSKFNLTTQDVSDWVIESEVPGSGTGIMSTYIVQRYQGIEIFNAQSNVSVKEGKVLNVGNNFKSNIAQKANTTTPVLTVFQAITSAYAKLGITKPATFAVSETINNKTFKLTDGLQEDVISAKLVYQHTADNKLKLAWGFQFYSPDAKHLWDLRIDALDGKILEKNDLNLTCNFGDKHNSKQDCSNKFSFENILFNNNTASMLTATPATYRVIPYNFESPNHSPFQLITTAGNEFASPNGWHNSNAIGGTTASLIFSYTRGNNVLAQEDANGDNGTGIRPDGGATLNFDFPQYVPGVGQTLQPTAYTPAATTNLFYMNNIMHDVMYQYGFNEASGNFQQNNYGKGGTVSATGDYVQADAQDGWNQTTATLNNANFATPNDGQRPRMQMFLWTLGAPPTNFITVNSPSNIAGPRAATTNVFEGTDRIPVPLAPNGITSDLVLYNNTVPLGFHSACQVPTNGLDIDGKIVLVKRGGCLFSLKVKNAQEAGATAVIVMDSIPNNPTRLSMSSTGLLGITIPAVFITKEIGDELLAEIALGPVNVKLESPADLYLFGDGDFDNGIIAHEYGHGISNKLIGGPVNAACMTNAEQMGEGWSDWFALMLQMKTGDLGTTPREIGTYAINQPTTGVGIRNFPYSTDMALNPLTLVNSNDDESHNRGEVLTAVLWDLTWAYVNQYGYDADIYSGTGGNNKVLKLVLDALKLQACNTASFISARDNIFAADLATTGGVNHDMIAEVFRRRGMGLNASSGDVASALDQVEDFTAFPLSTNQFSKADNIRIYPNPTNGLLNIRINQFVGKVNIQVVDINGRVVFNQTDDKFNVEKAINLNSFQSGVYIVKINTDEFNYSQKLIKQ